MRLHPGTGVPAAVMIPGLAAVSAVHLVTAWDLEAATALSPNLGAEVGTTTTITMKIVMSRTTLYGRSSSAMTRPTFKSGWQNAIFKYLSELINHFCAFLSLINFSFCIPLLSDQACLPKNYSRLVFPNDRVNVTIQFLINDILEIDDFKQRITFSMFLFMDWKDPRILYDKDFMYFVGGSIGLGRQEETSEIPACS